MNKQNRNLFIQVHQPDLNYSQSSLINNWTLPLPLEFHIINSPELNSKLSHLVPHSSPNKLNSIPQKHFPHSKSADRHKYYRFQQQLIFLEQFLLEFKDLKASQILEYRQKLLVRYLSQFVSQISVQCKEKGSFLQSIWNMFVRIFEQVFQRVVVDSKLLEKESLKSQINLHESYQNQLEMLQKINVNLKQEEAKTSSVISQLVNNIAIQKTQLKGSSSLIKQLTHKYEELRSQHIQLLVLSNEITEAQAQANLRDKQILLFTKQILNSQIPIKVKPKAQRRGRVLDNKLDVQLLLQQIQAESEYQFQFQIDSNAKSDQQIRYVNQKVQTIQIKKQITEQQTQWQNPYLSLQKGVQTDTMLKQQKSIEIQTDALNTMSKNPQRIVSCFKIDIKPQFNQQQQKDSTLSNSQSMKKSSIHKDNKNGGLSKSRNSLMSKERVSEKLDQKQLFRVVDSRISKRSSNLYHQKILKTEGATDNQSRTSVLKRKSSQKRVSDLILIQQLRQDYIKNYSRFRKGSAKKINLSQYFRQKVLDQSDCLEDVINLKANKEIKNVQFSLVYSGLIDNIRENMTVDRKKKLPPGKCMKQIGSIFKMATKLIHQGVFSLDLVSLTTQYLSALEGKHLAKQQKQKKFIQFIVSCIPLASTSYLIKSFLLLCGFPFGKTYYLRGTRNEKQRDQQKLDKQTSKYVFSSQVYAYFKLLSLANCQQSEEMLQAYTNEERLRNSLQILPSLYRGSSRLIEQLNLSVVQSMQLTQQKNPRLDIFKSLHLVIDKILGQKLKIIQTIEPLVFLIKQPDSSFATQIVSLLTTNQNSRFICSQVMKSIYCQSYNAYSLATMALIQGLELETNKFAVVQQDHKFTILKRLMFVESHKEKLLEAMIKAIPRKELRKNQFLVLLRMVWNRQAQRLIDNFMGKDLLALNEIGNSINLVPPPKDNYHSLAFDDIIQ